MSTVIGAEVTEEMKEEVDEYIEASDTAASRSAALRELVRAGLDGQSEEVAEMDPRRFNLYMSLAYLGSGTAWLLVWEQLPDLLTELPIVRHAPNTLFPLLLLIGTIGVLYAQFGANEKRQAIPAFDAVFGLGMDSDEQR